MLDYAGMANATQPLEGGPKPGTTDAEPLSYESAFQAANGSRLDPAMCSNTPRSPSGSNLITSNDAPIPPEGNAPLPGAFERFSEYPFLTNGSVFETPTYSFNYGHVSMALTGGSFPVQSGSATEGFATKFDAWTMSPHASCSFSNGAELSFDGTFLSSDAFGEL